MESVLQNSIISTSNNCSQKSNSSTARLLINHIKRVVEEDMNLTVKAFNYIENKIDFEHGSRSCNMENNRINFPIRNRLNRSSVQLRKSQRAICPSHQIDWSSHNYTDQQNFFGPEVTSTPLRTSSVEDFSYSEQDDPLVEGIGHKRYEPAMVSALSWNGSRSDNHSNVVTDNASELDMTTSDENDDTDIISLSRIRNLYSHFADELDAIFNRINERFRETPDLRIPNGRRPAIQTVTRRVYNDSTPTWIYNKDNSENPAQSSFVNSEKEINQLRLSQLLISDNERIQNSRGDLTNDCARVPFLADCLPQTSDHLPVSTDRRTDNILQRIDDSFQTTDTPSQGTDTPSQRTDTSRQGSDISPQRSDILQQRADTFPDRTDISPQRTNISLKTSDVSSQKTDALSQTTNNFLQETDHRDGLNYSTEKTVTPEEESAVRNTEDGDKNSERCEASNDQPVSTNENNERALETRTSKPEVNNAENYVIISDIGSEISSTLLATPKTAGKESQNNVELTDLDKIASLTKQASPNRRVIIKKKLPDAATKGYKKTCDEKLIFSGDKITHVKRDRKTMSRKINPVE